MARDAEEINPKNFFLVAHGRLKPGVTIANAETDLNRIETGLKAQGLVPIPSTSCACGRIAITWSVETCVERRCCWWPARPIYTG